MGKLLLLGYFGAGNLGDDGFVVDFLKRWQGELRAHRQTCDYTAAGSRNPIEGFAEAEEIGDLLGTAISRKGLLTLRQSAYDAMVAPGGSLLQNATSMRSLLFYLHVISRFINAGVPVYMLGQGLGPFKGKLAGPLAAKTLKHLKLLTLRDEASEKLASDLSPLLSADSLLSGRLAIESAVGPYDYAVLIPKPTSEDVNEAGPQYDALIELVDSVQTFASCHVLALHAGQDSDCVQELTRGGRATAFSALPFQNSNSALVGLIANCQLAISYRLHGLILAAAYGVPGLGVAYDPKVSAFCEEMGLPYCTPEDVLDGKAIELVRGLWHNREQVKATMLERCAVALQRLKAAETRFAQLMWGAL